MWQSSRRAVMYAVIMFATCANAQMMTITEAALKQSDIARAEMDARLEDARKKTSGLNGGLPVAPLPLKITEKDAEEVLSLISVYGVGDKLKADFLFRGAVITLDPDSGNQAAGWKVEKLSSTQAVLVKTVGKRIVKRNTVYLSAAAASAPAPSPAMLMPSPSMISAYGMAVAAPSPLAGAPGAYLPMPQVPAATAPVLASPQPSAAQAQTQAK